MSMGMKSQAQMTQIVSSLQVPDSAYGQAVPYIFGRCRVPQKLIWWSNLQYQNGGKKQAKSGSVTYTVNADMLLGYGPLEGIAAIWQNQTWWYVNYSTQAFTGSGTVSSLPFTISNNSTTVVMILGVQFAVPYSETYSDYGGYGVTRNLSLSGSAFLPLYNNLFPAPNYGTWANSGMPYAEYNSTYGDDSGTVFFPGGALNPAILVFYCEVGGSDQPPAANQGKKGGGGVPVQQPGLTFENVLGSGPSGNLQAFPEFSGCGGANIPLGSSPELPYLNFEVKGLFGLGNVSPASSFDTSTGGYTAAQGSGDCCPADVMLDIITSGNRNDALNSSETIIWHHGLNFTQAVGTNSEYCYARYGGILADESNLWNAGSNLGLNAVRDYCMAYGIFISGYLDSQTSAADFLTQICRVANCAPVWDGAALNFIPYCEVSNYANGFSYVAPTASGPIFALTTQHFIPQEDKSPVTWDRDRPNPIFNTLQIGFRDATQQFNSNYVIISDTMDIAVEGSMPGSQENHDYITGAPLAQAIGWGLLRRNLTIERQEFRFKLPAYWETLLTPMDLVTLYDGLPGQQGNLLFPTPVRIKSIDISIDKDKGKREMSCTAEPFIYGGSVPLAPTTTGAPGTSGNGGGGGGAPPGSVNTPIFIETVPGMYTAGPQIWICVSGSGAAYGGCAIWMSVDGGATYGAGPIGVVTGRQTMGLVYNSNYPSHADPDNSDDLYVDLTESFGSLTSVSAAAQNAFASLMYLQGGGTIVVNDTTLTIPYELVAFQGVTLAATNKYECTPPIRRGVYNTPPAAHPIGNQVSYLKDGVVFAMNLTQSLIGLTLYFKFTAFNNTGGSQQQLSSATPYTFTPSGLVGWTYNAGGGGGTGTTPTQGGADDNEAYVPGPYTAGQQIAKIIPGRQLNWPAGLTGSLGVVDTNPTSAVQITITKNGTSVGTVNISTSGVVTFTLATAVSFNGIGDWWSLIAPGPTADPTFAGLSVTFYGSRTN
jgi:hypothetical protein